MAKKNKKVDIETQKQMLGALATTVYVLTSVAEAEGTRINLQNAIQLAVFQMDGLVAILGDEVSKQVIEEASHFSMPQEEVVSEQV